MTTDKRRTYTAEDVADMVFTAKKLGSYRKAAIELGVNPETVRYHCRKNGLFFAGPHEICKAKKQLVIDGHTFYWSHKRYYRGSVDGERMLLSDYMHRKIYGTPKPKHTVIMFRDGDSDNYSTDNVYFVSASEFMKKINENPEVKARNRDLLDKGRESIIAAEREKPWLRKRRMQRMVTTRRRNDPDNCYARKASDTRRKRAEERGYWYTDEQRVHMSEGHKGLTKEVLAMRRREKEHAAVRQRMGMQ